jgi:hypothetical protein
MAESSPFADADAIKTNQIPMSPAPNTALPEVRPVNLDVRPSTFAELKRIGFLNERG